MNITDIVDYLPEIYFYHDVVRKHAISNIVFDIGCSKESIYLEEEIEVHYFEPYKESLDELMSKTCLNTKAYFNNFGLSNEENVVKYYDAGSIFNREKLNTSEIAEVKVMRGEEYIMATNVSSIDLLKIDVEGFELNVLKGFGDKLNNVSFIQFEYGDGLADAGFKMIDIINYLKSYGFENFSTLIRPLGYEEITNYDDHWRWCNIICRNTNIIK